MKKLSRPVSFAICLLVYLIAIAVSIFSILNSNRIINSEENISQLLIILYADIIATIVVFGFSVAFKNSSLYDPYWSVAPPLIAIFWIKDGSHDVTAYLMLISILLWSVRLTLNWCRGWQGLSHEDWRYKMLREKNPRLYPLINLFGIHLFPTMMVFLGMLPVYIVLIESTEFSANKTLLFIGLLITISAIAIELIADEQMHQFKKQAKKVDFINSGLWKYSRHPNYFGEILFWFGLWIMQMAVAPQYWFTAIGFVAMLFMFLFASIPMMEAKNLKNKSGYSNYIKRVSILIPLPVLKEKIGQG